MTGLALCRPIKPLSSVMTSKIFSSDCTDHLRVALRLVDYSAMNPFDLPLQGR
jgi:hypothetical protein